MTYATWRGLHFAPPCGLFRCSVNIKTFITTSKKAFKAPSFAC